MSRENFPFIWSFGKEKDPEWSSIDEQACGYDYPIAYFPKNISYYNQHSLDLEKKEEKKKQTDFNTGQTTCLHCRWQKKKQKKTWHGYITQWSFIKVKFYSSMQHLKEK